MFRVLSYLLLLCFVAIPGSLSAQRITYELREVASGLNNPWEMRFASDGYLYFTERPGRFNRLDLTTGENTTLWTASDAAVEYDAGMMGFDFHPSFPDSPFVYIAYTYYVSKDGPYAYGLFRLKLDGDSLTDRRQLFGPYMASTSHNGSRVVARGEHLYFSLGDAFWPISAQQAADGHGKVNRLMLDGSIPKDNPFPNSPAWSIGHRNPQGLEFSPSGKLYSSEHGTEVDDEVNLIQRGRNYGWPMVQGRCDSDSEAVFCDSLDVVESMYNWSPTIAVGDLQYFSDPSIPEWQTSLLLATLKDRTLHVMKLDSSEESITHITPYTLEFPDGELLGRLRSICMSADGRLFISSGNGFFPSDSTDRILELVRTGIAPEVPVLDEPADATVLDTPTVALRWLPAFPAARFEVQVSTDPTFSSGSLILKTQVSDTVVALHSLVIAGRYYWRVRELTTNGPWSEVRTFVTATAGVVEEDADSPFTISTVNRELRISAAVAQRAVDVTVYDLLGRQVAFKHFEEIGQGRSATIRANLTGLGLVKVFYKGREAWHSVIFR